MRGGTERKSGSSGNSRFAVAAFSLNCHSFPGAGSGYFEYKINDDTNYSIDYTLNKDSLEEINVQINSNDLELANYLFCDLKDYYANKLPNPTEDKGYVVYNCFEGQRKPFVVSRFFTE